MKLEWQMKGFKIQINQYVTNFIIYAMSVRMFIVSLSRKLVNSASKLPIKKLLFGLKSYVGKLIKLS